MILTGGKPQYSEKPRTSATLPTTNLTSNGLKSHPGLRGVRTVTNRLYTISITII
jgi:hypothetical protein